MATLVDKRIDALPKTKQVAISCNNILSKISLKLQGT